MSVKPPGILAVRAVNQYRSREVMTYLGLRYYLENTAARSDEWAQQVATDLVLTRTDLPYFRACNFKETDANGQILHRPIYVPGPNEALAEAALLAECANYPKVFFPPACVFSYRLNDDPKKGWMYEYYFKGFQERKEAIKSACDACPTGVVRYVDIKRFYPSITSKYAHTVWQQYTSQTGLPKQYIDLGEKLIDDYGKVSQSVGDSELTGRILTGPMFSHLIGNLVLREIDDELSASACGYFRYVDDVTLVGDTGAVNHSLDTLKKHLDKLDLHLHDETSEKYMCLSTSEWLTQEPPSQESDTLRWDIQNFLFTRSDALTILEDVFLGNGFRIPLKDYSIAATEAPRVKWFRQLASKFRFKQQIIEEIHEEKLLYYAKLYSDDYKSEFCKLITQLPNSDDHQHTYRRKRTISRLRYLIGRLIHLAPERNLVYLSQLAATIPELYFQTKVMEAITSGNIDSILGMGTNVAQVTAQVMKAAKKQVSCTLSKFSDVQTASLAMFLVNGVKVNCSATPKSNLELLRFARSGGDAELMRSADPFLREIACLHGIQQPRHAHMLETAFDRREALIMDAITTLVYSFV